jgi:DNA helicase-2/ATP-dependent DNA helicase PcrA
MARKKATKAAKPVAEGPRFTEAQQQVIDHTSGPMLAGAVAGAGKSTTLVERVARLNASGVPLNRIMLSAFNVDAATDLNRKLKKRLGLKGEDVEVARTLHGLAHAIWKSSPGSIGFGLDKTGSTYGRAIRQGGASIGYDHVEADLVKKFASRVKNDCLVNSFVTGLRALGQTPGELVDVAAGIVRKKKNCATTPAVLLDLYFAAEDARVSGTQLPDGTWSKFVTFDDLLAEASRLLTEDDQARTQWQARFDHVIVDESQDLCEAQWRIVNALAEGHRNIVVVGDPGQAIYTFRGAKPEHFLNFGNAWPGVKNVYMDANFRSGSDIIRVANVVLDAIPDSQKLPMRLHCTRDAAGFVGYRETDSPRTEAEDIAFNIRKHHDAGVEWRDQAILVRRNDQSGRLELELLKAKIPARVVRGNSFFASREAKTALAYLRLIAGAADEDDFETTIQNPPKYLGRVFIDAIVHAWKADLDWLDVMDSAPIVQDRKYNGNARDFMGKIRELRVSLAKGATPLQLFTKLCQKMNWENWLAADADKEAAPDNDAAMNFDRVRDFLSDFDDLPSLFQLIAELKTAQRSAASSRNAVSIATCHSVKGLEYQVVYVAGMIKGTWPVAWGDDDPVDERRVFYVAVTRARDELWFNGYRYKDDDGAKDAEPSPYLKELGLSPTDRTGRAVIASGQMSMLGS